MKVYTYNPMLNKVLFLLLVMHLLAGFKAKAQNDTVFFDTKWQQTSRAQAAYFRLISHTGKIYNVNDYYLNGTLQMSGQLTSLDTPNNKYENGHFIYYSDKGLKLSEGDMKDGRKTGVWHYYNEHTNVLSLVERYVNGVSNGPFTVYDSVTGKIKRTGSAVKGKVEGEMLIYDATGRILRSYQFVHDTIRFCKEYIYNSGIYSEGPLTNDKKNGVWKTFNMHSKRLLNSNTYANDILNGISNSFHRNGKIWSIKLYLYGNIVTNTCYDTSGAVIPCITTGQWEKKINMNDYLKQHLTCITRNNASQYSLLVVRYCIEENGDISDIIVHTGFGKECDEKARQLIMQYPDFKISYKDGLPIKTCYNFGRFIEIE